MLTYPLSRSSYLVGKVLFNVSIAIVQAIATVALAALILGVPMRPAGFPLLVAGVVVGTAGWFFFYAIFALRIRRNDAFNTVTSVFYFVFLFASSMFYPVDPLPRRRSASRRWRIRSPGRWTCCATRRSATAIRRASCGKRSRSSGSRCCRSGSRIARCGIRSRCCRPRVAVRCSRQIALECGGFIACDVRPVGMRKSIARAESRQQLVPRAAQLEALDGAVGRIHDPVERDTMRGETPRLQLPIAVRGRR